MSTQAIGAIFSDMNVNCQKVNIFGAIKIENGLPFYKSSIDESEIVHVDLVSHDMLSSGFRKLDDFLGETYRRELVAYELNGKIFVSNIYVANSSW